MDGYHPLIFTFLWFSGGNILFFFTCNVISKFKIYNTAGSYCEVLNVIHDAILSTDNVTRKR